MKENVVIDTSALLALFRQEPGWQEVSTALNDSTCLMSAVNMAEVAAKAQKDMNVQAAVADMSQNTCLATPAMRLPCLPYYLNRYKLLTWPKKRNRSNGSPAATRI